MNNIEQYIMSFGGHHHRVCFRVLCASIEVAMEYPSELPPMKTLAVEVHQRTPKWKTGAILKSLSRAVENIWDYGNHDVLVSHQPCWHNYKPLPQEFIYIVVAKLRDEKSNHS